MSAALSHPVLFSTSTFPPPIFEPGRPASSGGRRVASWLLALLVVLLSGAATRTLAQTTAPPDCSQDEKFINQWYFGYKAGLDFNQATDSIPPTVLTNSQMSAPAGSGIMADGTGNLLFYSNGDTVWSRNHSIMPGGTGMGGNRLCTDGPLAIKMPGSPTTAGGPTSYLLFTQDAQGGPKGLSYSEIVIPVGQQGSVTLATKNTPLTQGTTEKMTGVLHKNGCDIWIIVHGWGTATSGTANRGDSFLAYRVTPTGVQTTPVISTIGAVHSNATTQGYRGQMKVSPDGSQLAVARYSTVLGDSSSTVELFAFDAATGAVSGRKAIDAKAGRYYGVEFSPSRSRLYATVMSPPQLLQFDLSATNIPASKQVIPLKQTTPVNLGSMQAGPDGKIYVARENQLAIGFIAHPDSLGAKAAYADDSLQLGGRRGGLGLPNFNQSSLLRVGFGGMSTACQEITFQAGSPIPNPQSYAWNFGDPGSGGNNTSAVANPVHVFTAPGTYTVTLRITNFCFCREVTLQVPVPGAPTPGSIGAGQTICAGTAPAALTSTAPAAAGIGQYSYQWQSSPNSATWTDISGANAPGYVPGALAVTTYFRRLVTSGFCGPRTPTAAVTITVTPAVTAGSIAANQTICAGSAPAPLTSSAAATGGTGTFAYQWQSSPNSATWAAIPGATSATYAPGALTATTYFRRQVSSGACAGDTSNVVTIAVVPGLVAGSIAADQALCGGAAAAPLTSTAPATGGTGTIDYQWEASPDNVTWTAIGGATGPTYAPGALTATTYFRRRAGSGSACAPVYSNVVTISVAPAVTAGSVAADQTLCYNTAPAPLTSTAGAGGGTGSFTYQWESSPDNVTWTPIANANGAIYSIGPLTATTYFRRGVTSGGCGPVYTNVVTLTVLPQLQPGTIAADQTVCAGTAPAPLTSTAGGSGSAGSFTYQWEVSPDNVTWTAVGGATGPTYAPGALTATTYYRRRVASGTCPTEVSNVVTIQVQPLVTTTVTLAAPPVQCPGTPLTFTAVPTGAGTAPTFQWFVNNVAVASGPTFTSSTLTTGDVVRVDVTATAGLCSTGPATASVTVTRTPTTTPTLTIAGQPGAVCPGELLTFSIASVTGAGPTSTYQWQVNGTDVAGATNAVFSSTALLNGQTVTLRLRTTDNCGQAVTVVSNGVAVQILPPVVVDAGPDQEILLGTSVTLQGTATGGPVTWTPAIGLTFPANDPLHPVAAPTVTTTYTLTGGTGGCTTTDQVTVTVRPPIRIPNAFTPNSDGNDDTWQIEHIEEYPNNTVTVYNRWGSKIFSAENYSRANEWRGDYNGQPLPIGTFYYVVVTRGPLGRSYAGWVTILY